MRLSASLAASTTPPTLNPLGDLQLTLRALSLPAVENLATFGAHDTLDLSRNNLTELGPGFPRLPRVHTLYAGGNRIARVTPDLRDRLPGLRVLVLTGNCIARVEDLGGVQAEVLCLAGNPVMGGGRVAVVRAVRGLKVLNFQKVSQAERKAAGVVEEGSGVGERMVTVENGNGNTTKKKKRKKKNGRKRKGEGEEESAGVKKRRRGGVEVVKTFTVGALGEEEEEKEEEEGDKVEEDGDGSDGGGGRGGAVTEEQARKLRAFVERATSVEQVVSMQEAVKKGRIEQFLNSIVGETTAERQAAAG